jgi:hypothetical protein
MLTERLSITTGNRVTDRIIDRLVPKVASEKLFKNVRSGQFPVISIFISFDKIGLEPVAHQAQLNVCF